MTGSAVVVEGIGKWFGAKVALHDVNIVVPEGSVCGLVGPNGAGKTTLLKLLLDLLRPTSGRVRVLGLDPARESLVVRQRVGYVPETRHIYPWLSGERLLRVCADLYPTWDDQACGRINELLKVPLARKVADLSRGELAKLSLLVAMAHGPRLLVLDEPTSGLDPIVRREFLSSIRELLEQRDRTVLFSTHILSDVEQVADRLVMLDRGAVVVSETLASLRERFGEIGVEEMFVRLVKQGEEARS